VGRSLFRSRPMIVESRTPETAAQVQPTALRQTAAKETTNPAWQHQFLTLLPSIRRHAKLRFRNLSPELREELVQETVARALLDFVRLVEQGREHIACAGPLARYAVAQVRQGRKVGSRLNVRDVTSHYSQQRTGAVVERLDRCDEAAGGWQEILVEDRRSTPAEIAATRIDVREWFQSLPQRNRRIAERLAVGESTSTVARIFNLTPSRIAQLRRELYDAWRMFQGEPVPAWAS
jgi:DNA-directed RNA polymerase specialized sigma24 family protein